jgi:hypothetical protein
MPFQILHLSLKLLQCIGEAMQHVIHLGVLEQILPVRRSGRWSHGKRTESIPLLCVRTPNNLEFQPLTPCGRRGRVLTSNFWA